MPFPKIKITAEHLKKLFQLFKFVLIISSVYYNFFTKKMYEDIHNRNVKI